MTSAEKKICSQEFWANKNGIRLWVNRKFLEGTAGQRELLFLVHGSSYSAKTMFDLQVEGPKTYSMMDHFVRMGYEVWTMDHEGWNREDGGCMVDDALWRTDDGGWHMVGGWWREE
jgi:hypothetical protein